MMKALLGADQVICLNSELPRCIGTSVDLTLLADYPNNIYQNIETEKASLKHRKSERQLLIALSIYSLLKEFIKKVRPDYILYAQPPEGMIGMILAGLVRELNLELVVPHHTRALGRSFFSGSEQEVLPSGYPKSSVAREMAEKFLQAFRTRHVSPSSFQSADHADEIIPHELPGRLERIKGFVMRTLTEKESREASTLRVSLLNNLPFYRDLHRGLRRAINRRNHNCADLSLLPTKFIFYPLQYTPESSINVPAPYFVDQLRIIDAIRLSMPNDMLLVVKEHPACILVRPGSFTRRLLHTAGVVVARHDMNTQEIIKSAQLTISVTGTAALEAFLYGKPSIVMAPTFFSGLLGGICAISDLGERIRTLIGTTIPDALVVDGLAGVYETSADFLGRSPGEVGNRMMTRRNVAAFWQQFLVHVEICKSNYQS